jgi:hypothetical protein
MALKTNFAAKPTLTGEIVLLRPVEATDAAGMLAVDPETKRLTGSQSSDFFTLESLEKWYVTRAEHDDRLDLSIIDRATGKWLEKSCSTNWTCRTNRAGSGLRCRVPSSTGEDWGLKQRG